MPCVPVAIELGDSAISPPYNVVRSACPRAFFGGQRTSAETATALPDRGEPVSDEQGKRLGTWAGIYRPSHRYSLEALIGLKSATLDVELTVNETDAKLRESDRAVQQQWLVELAERHLQPFGIKLVKPGEKGSDCFEIINVRVMVVTFKDASYYAVETLVILQQAVRLRRSPRPTVLAVVFAAPAAVSQVPVGRLSEQVEGNLRIQFEFLAAAIREASRNSTRLPELGSVSLGEVPGRGSGLLQLVMRTFPNDENAKYLNEYGRANLSPEDFEAHCAKRLRDKGVCLRWPHSHRLAQAQLWLGLEAIDWHPEDKLFCFGIESTVSEPAELLRLPTTFVDADIYRSYVVGAVSQPKAATYIRELLDKEMDKLPLD